MKMFLSVFMAVGALASAADQDPPCFLRSGEKPKKPFPSLTQCYKNNQKACCVSAHDASIESEYTGLLSSTCLREYPFLEHFFCLGCNPDMNNFIQWYHPETKSKCQTGGTGCKYLPYEKPAANATWQEKAKHGKKGMIKIEENFLNKLLFSDASLDDGCEAKDGKCAIDKYDNCGLVIGDSGVYPSAHYVDANGDPDYLMFLNDIRPTFFLTQDFHISVGYLDATALTEDEYNATVRNPLDYSSGYFYEKWEKADMAFDSAPRSVTVSTSLTVVVMLAHFARQHL